MRHSYKEWWFDSPRVWVFTNEAPKLKYLTAGRWRFWDITEAKELRSVDHFLGDPTGLEEPPKKRQYYD